VMHISFEILHHIVTVKLVIGHLSDR